MNSTHEQDDCESGQEAPLTTSSSSISSSLEEASAPTASSRRSASVLACCALGAFVVTAGTYEYLPSLNIQAQSLPQEHRRLTTIVGQQQQHQQQEERHLSAISRFFNVIFVSTAPEDEIGFGKEDVGEEYSFNMEGENAQCPGQNMGLGALGLYSEIPRIWSPDLGVFGMDEFITDGRDPERTFAVEPKHTVLKGIGVRFNVEEVPAAHPQDLNKTRLPQDKIDASLQAEAAEFYEVKASEKSRKSPGGPVIEASSRMPGNSKDGSGTVFTSGQGFLAACMTAFAHHLPLALSPDDLWTVISNGFARHLDAHAEELRANFVAHKGQEKIRIREDSMVKGASPPEQWEDLIFPKFVEGIAENVINPELIETLAVRNFTTSTPASQAASGITLMAQMKNYFTFQMDTMCGIPNVRLEGTREDWEALRERTKTLARYMRQDDTHGDLWIYDIVLPILDEFLRSYDGEVDYCFWQNMVKFRTTGSGSGSFDFLSGWLHTLFPYLSANGGTSRPNPYLQPWLASASAHLLGPTPQEIPIQLSSVPVQWMYHEKVYPMHFHAGFRGVHQEADGTVSPIIGWYVTEDPEEER